MALCYTKVFNDKWDLQVSIEVKKLTEQEPLRVKRKKRLMLNSASSLLFQIITIICGLILPRLILVSFGSEVNGLVNSITQFLTIIAFLELGVGSVVQSSLYKPLADNNRQAISSIVASANKFFKRLAIILLVYIIVLIALFPYISHSSFDFVYTGTLIAAMGISSFAQYYFGVVDRLLLTADQKGYVQYIAQSVTLVLNTIACIFLMRIGVSIQFFKLITSLIYLIRPAFLRWYVNAHYSIDRYIQYQGEPIKQKWNGVAQHVAAIVLDNTDTIVLTVLSTLSNVSIYGVYHIVVNGVKTLFTSMMNGIQSLFGELWARQELKELEHVFSNAEWAVHTVVTFAFGCTASLIVPFVQVYTRGITDTNYNVPAFALLITLANALHCLRLPYNLMILAGGHYKQTQSNYIIAAIVNIIISVATVKLWGLIGVAIGTLAAMLYQTIWMASYDSKNFIKRPFYKFAKHMLIDIIEFVIAFTICSRLPFNHIDYLSWLILAIECATVWMMIAMICNYVFYRRHLLGIGHKLNSLLHIQ